MEAFINAQHDQQIPLLCTVCPETPRFSDVSHLLTHIASKGHLHHETQTKLKSHQDLSAAVTLQEYERWYRDYRIESLLVDRMKAKQIKEVARHRRSRATIPSAQQTTLSKPRKRNRRDSAASVRIKPEDLTGDVAVYPDVFAAGNDADLQVEYIAKNDSLSLKGQIWPGMGKMDLADDDMKRTRNQRKPKSAIERMRRTSEGIEPNQVVMTADFEVERIKGVYDDSSSPIPGQEDATPPRKVPKPRRKKAEPLTEISGNISRGRGRKAKGIKKETMVNKDDIGQPRPEVRSFSRAGDIFRDEDTTFNLYDSKPYSFTPSNQSLFDTRDRASIHTSNAIPNHHAIYSATQDIFSNGTQSSGRDLTRGRRLGLPFIRHLGHNTLSTYLRSENTYPVDEGSNYSSPNQIPSAENHQPSVSQSQYRLPSQAHSREKHEYFSPPGLDATQLYMATTNPLYSQDHLLFRSYDRYASRGPHHSELTEPFSSATRSGHRDLFDTSQHNNLSTSQHDVKMEPTLCDSIELTDCDEMKQPHFIPHAQWDNTTTGRGNTASPNLDNVSTGL